MNLNQEIYKAGYNIYQYVNAFKARQRRIGATVEIPDSVLQDACRDFYFQAKRQKIEKPYPYFVTLINRKRDDYNANRCQKMSKNQLLVLGEILRGIQIQHQETAEESRETVERVCTPA